MGPALIRIIGGKDIADGHGGTVVQAEAGLGLPIATALSASISGSTSWADKRYMNAYFGVTAPRALASGLPVFIADAGLKDATATVGLNYQLSRRWSVSVIGSYGRLLRDAKDNPLVMRRGSPDQLQAGAFLAFSF